MPLNKREILTIPNAVTFTRLAAMPYLIKKMHDEPAKWWFKTGVVMLSDRLDGALARLGDNNERLEAMGFRRSEIGRQVDPVTDKLFGSALVIAGLHNRVVPKWLGAVSLVQKAAVSAQTARAKLNGIEVEVSEEGRRAEMAAEMGTGLLFAAESIENNSYRQLARIGAASMALAGIWMAHEAAKGYREKINVVESSSNLTFTDQ